MQLQLEAGLSLPAAACLDSSEGPGRQLLLASQSLLLLLRLLQSLKACWLS